MTPIEVQLLGFDNPERALFKSDFPQFSILDETTPLPGKKGILIIQGDGADERTQEFLPAAIRSRTPVALASPERWSAERIQRLSQSLRHRKIPSAALGGLRFVPAIARLKEMLTAGLFGTIIEFHIGAKPTTWQHYDLAHWLFQSPLPSGPETGAGTRIRISGTAGSAVFSLFPGKNAEAKIVVGNKQRQLLLPRFPNAHAEPTLLSHLVREKQNPLLPSVPDFAACQKQDAPEK